VQLAAVSRADGIDLSLLDGTVAAAFDRACTIDCRNGRLVTLAAESSGNMPGAILVALPTGFRFADHIAAGTQVFARGGLLRFATGSLSVDLRPAKRWSSGIAALDIDMTLATVRHAWEEAAAILDHDGRAAPLQALAGSTIMALGEAAARGNGRMAGAHAARLIGLGEGATPAGDDFLVGFLGGLWASAQRNTGFVEALCAVIVTRTQATSRASRVYLEAATAGQVSERLTDLASALARGDVEGAKAAMHAALAVGHSSGACGVLGLLQGITAATTEAGLALIV
jgi:hypothetical protein